MLREHLGILESDAPESALRQLAGREILALALGLDVAGDLHPLVARDQLHRAWVDFASDLAVEHPAVLLIEDLHWADEELVERRPAWGGGRRNSSLLWLDPLSAGDAEQMIVELLGADLPSRLRELLVERAGGNPF